MSRIEQQIDHIEDYIYSCKPQAFSNSKIVVDREILEDMLEELRNRTPEEIRHYQKIIDNKEEILRDARARAEALIQEATAQTNALISENEIMRQATLQANELLRMSSAQGQEILDQAVEEANTYRTSAAGYMDSMLAELQTVTTQSVRDIDATYQEAVRALEAMHRRYMEELKGYLDTISKNRAELKVLQGAEESDPDSFTQTIQIGEPEGGPRADLLYGGY